MRWFLPDGIGGIDGIDDIDDMWGDPVLMYAVHDGVTAARTAPAV